MANTFKNAAFSAASLSLLLGLVAAPAMAQNNAGFDDLSGDSDSSEVFGGSGVSLTDLLSNARRADGLSTDEFNSRTDSNINDAAADFRQRQQDALGNGQGAAVETPDFEEQL